MLIPGNIGPGPQLNVPGGAMPMILFRLPVRLAAAGVSLGRVVAAVRVAVAGPRRLRSRGQGQQRRVKIRRRRRLVGDRQRTQRLGRRVVMRERLDAQGIAQRRARRDLSQHQGQREEQDRMEQRAGRVGKEALPHALLDTIEAAFNRRHGIASCRFFRLIFAGFARNYSRFAAVQE
jgi:hypothetical protein